MLGRQKLTSLNLQKQVLLVESDLNRISLQAELQNLLSTTSWVSEASRVSRRFTPLLIGLAPLLGFFLTKNRGPRRQHSWFSRATGALKWLLPIYRLWRSFTGEQRAARPGMRTA
jgi:hypothetical protein